jgi:hypothetical protein
MADIRAENVELTWRRNSQAFNSESVEFFDLRQGQKDRLDRLLIPPVVGRRELITPNPKLKLLDQVSEVMRFKHYSVRAETSYRDVLHQKLGPLAEVERAQRPERLPTMLTCSP